MNALTVSVGYDDLLRITLPRMAAVFERLCVVTDPHDHRTVLVAESQDNVFAYQTDAFTRDGAAFNKGLAMEEGLDHLGRQQGWICCIDADVLLPETVEFPALQPGNLYGVRRKICPDPARWQERWQQWRATREAELGGYFHLFHAEDAVLEGRRPWYGTNFQHAGGCDSQFEALWPRRCKRRLPLHVLHLGPVKQNWWGRQTQRLDGREPSGAVRSRELLEKMLHHRQQGDYQWEQLNTQETEQEV